jgi:glycosyltransferase involved in cell wall biosynthesis
VALRPGRARLRVGLAIATDALDESTGHGRVWSHVIDELRGGGEIRFVGRGRADVWLGDGHSEPPDGRPLVVQVHEAGWVDPELRAFLDPGFATGIEATTRAALEVAARVITPSEAARRQVSASMGFPVERIDAVHHGVDHRLFKPGITGGRELVAAPYVLFVSVLHPRKNLAAVRGAVGDLAASGLPHVLVVVGNPPADPGADRFDAEARAELDGHPDRVVNFRALPAPQLGALMAGAEVFCLPSYFEGFGLPVLESMACGAPVVVSDRGALPEVVGDAGLVVSPDADAVSAAVQRVVTDAELGASMRRASAARAAQFGWDRTAAGWLHALRRAC